MLGSAADEYRQSQEFCGARKVIEHPQPEDAQEIQMKKLLTVSAVVLLMIFTAGLSTATAASAVFFGGTGNLISLTDLGSPPTTTATITVNEASNGLFYGTIVITSPATTIDFSAVRDSTGAYIFNGQTVTVDSAPTASVGTPAPVIVKGAFTISNHKNPALPRHAKAVLAAAIEFSTLDPSATSYAGLLFNEAE